MIKVISLTTSDKRKINIVISNIKTFQSFISQNNISLTEIIFIDNSESLIVLENVSEIKNLINSI